MALYQQDTVQKREPASCSRLNDMVRCSVGQKVRENNFNARNEKRQQLGKEPPRRNPKVKGKETSKDRKHGECTQWTSEGQCSRGDSCSSKHDLNKKRKSEKKKIPFCFRNEKTLEKETEKDRQNSEKIPYATIFRRGSGKKESTYDY